MQGYFNGFQAFALETTFVATYAFLEGEMMGICRLVGNHLSIKGGPEEVKRDKGINAARAYLKKKCNITVPNDRPWQQAQHYGRLRNLFSHTRGRVKGGETRVQQYVAANATKLSIDENNQLRITKDFCLEVLDNVEKLLMSLLHLARQRITKT